MAEGTLCAGDKQRNDLIDIMRVVGLVLIILAHTIPSSWLLFQFRNFDVPMMALVSGMAFCVSSPERIKLGSYYWKRVLRLLLPTYVFLTIFFVVTCLFFAVAGQDFPFKGKVLSTYLLKNPNSIGYIWIIGIFLMIALTAPLLHAIWGRLSLKGFAAFLFGMYICYEFLYRMVPDIRIEDEQLNHVVNTILSVYIYHAIGYTIIFGVGMLLIRLGAKHRSALAVLFLVLLVGWMMVLQGNNEPQMDNAQNFVAKCGAMFSSDSDIRAFVKSEFQPQSYKYPPRSLYVAWGLFMSAMLSVVLCRARLGGAARRLVEFMSSASLWIYLWHIVVLHLILWHVPYLHERHWLKFFVVLLSSTQLTFLHRFFFTKAAGALEGAPAARRFVVEAFLK